MGVLVVELHDELSEIVGGVYGVVELFAYEGQLKAGIIVMACLEIAQQSWQGEVQGRDVGPLAVYGVVDHGKEGCGVDLLLFAHLADGLVAEAEAYAEAAQALQHVIVVLDEGYHLVVSLINFLLSHVS